jgi:hypothetical protein
MLTIKLRRVSRVFEETFALAYNYVDIDIFFLFFSKFSASGINSTPHPDLVNKKIFMNLWNEICNSDMHQIYNFITCSQIPLCCMEDALPEMLESCKSWNGI